MKIIFAAAMLFAALTTLAQQPATPQPKPLSVTYFKNGFRKVSSRDSADFVRVIFPPDSGSELYKLRDYYASNKKLKFTGKISKPNVVNGYEGECFALYPNGNIQFQCNFKNGVKYGVYKEFYPNGKLHLIEDYRTDPAAPKNVIPRIMTCVDTTGVAIVNNGNGYYKAGVVDENVAAYSLYEEGHIEDGLRTGVWHGKNVPAAKSIMQGYAHQMKFTEEYNKGEMVSGIAADSAGTTFHYAKRFTMAQFMGGINDLFQYISHEIKYPADARRNNIEGKVYITFIVNTDGTLSDIKVLKGVNDELNNEAMRVINNSSSKWITATEYGKPVKQIFTLPISFKLTGG